ncbi:hypothetical protein [Pantoea allii]|uniref:hypothetical protein n=2 Tax=Pantoea allii TaxID=574096 RepID=UPI003D320C9B
MKRKIMEDCRSDNEGRQRLMTLGEIALARSVFSPSIVYPRVWIHHASDFPFKLQGRNTTMSPDGELYFRDWYCEDVVSALTYNKQVIFPAEKQPKAGLFCIQPAKFRFENGQEYFTYIEVNKKQRMRIKRLQEKPMSRPSGW